MIVLYHDDLDGRCASAIVRREFIGSDVKCFPVVYQHPLPIDKIRFGEAVYLVDFTPSTVDDFNAILKASGGNVVWIDHHKKNIDKFPELNKSLAGLRVDTKPSGAVLTWQYFRKDIEVPYFIQLVGDMDTWSWLLPETASFVAGMMAEDNKPESPIWDSLFSDRSFINSICRDGEIIIKYREHRDKEYLEKNGFECTFEGYRCIACNIGVVGSLFFKSVDDKDYDIMIPFSFDGKMFNVSLYTKKSIRVCDLAIKYGGGGHPNAAGFSCLELPFRKS